MSGGEHFSEIIKLVTQKTGIVPRESHKSGIQNFIQKRCDEKGLAGMKEYRDLIAIDQEEFNIFINGATVNETYFFREEAQFALLKEKIFPLLKKSCGTKAAPLKIWSAAASTGEEAYSLLLLASAAGITTEICASDINTDALKKIEQARYGQNAVRKLDGAKFQHLLYPYKTDSGEIAFPPQMTAQIERRQINLSRRDAAFPKGRHIVFARNVFIYFTMEMRKAILQKIADEALAEGGYLFVSMSEIPSLDSSIIPKSLEKKADGKVFYFIKK